MLLTGLWITAECLLVVYERTRRASIIFVLKERVIFERKCEAWSWLCALWWLTRQKPVPLCSLRRAPADGTPAGCAESTESSYAKQVPAMAHGGTQYSTGRPPHPNGFLRVFSKKPFGRTNAWVCHPHREVNISISVSVAAVEVTTKCSTQLHTLDQQPSRGGYLLPLLCDPWIYANLDSCAYTCVFVNIRVRKNMCMLTFI